MAPRRIPLAVLVLALAWRSAPAFAGDVVVMTNEKRVEGRIVSEDAASVVIEQKTAGGTITLTIARKSIRTIERGVPDPVPAPGTPQVVRDEWWLLESDGRIVGTRHSLVSRVEGSKAGLAEAGRPDAKGFRLEEQVVLFPPSPRLPGVRVQRIEETDDDLLPRDLHYREVGDAGPQEGGVLSYETIRSGPVRDGVWKMIERVGKTEVHRDLAVPAGARGPLCAREAILRASPRVVGLGDVLLVDPALGSTRKAKAGFASLGGGPVEAREDVMRWEDGDRFREGRVVGLRGVREDVAPGIVAVATTEARATAATEASIPPAGESKREVVLPDCGIALALPGLSWTAQTFAPRSASEGSRVVAKMESRLFAADARIEWDPNGVAAEPSPKDEPERPILQRLRTLSPDLKASSPRSAVKDLPGAWRMTLSGTLRGERVRTLLLVAERGDARVTVIAACQEAAWADAREALEALLASFRWL